MRTRTAGLVAFLAMACIGVANATNWSSQTHDIYPGDFDGDNRDDLLVIAKDPAAFSGIFTSGSGAPSTQLQSWNSSFLGINWHSGTYTATVGDFNGDNRDDVLLQRTSSGYSYVLHANSEGRLYGIHQVLSAWDRTHYRIVSGNFNGDARDDLFLQAASSSGTNHVMHANGAGQFGSAAQSWSNSHLGFKWSVQNALVHVGDFNGDNRDDLLVQAKPGIILIDYDVPIPVPVYKPQSFGLTLATSGGQFTSIHQLWSRKDFGVDWAPNMADVVIGDLNGDGRDDVMLVARNAAHSSHVLLATTSGQISTAPSQTLAPGALGTNWSAVEYRMVAGDFNGDGRAEIYRQATSPSGTNSIASLTSSGTVSAVTTHNAPAITNGLTSAIGRMPGEFAVGTSGNATYEVPIELQPGTNGLKPTLSFVYSSVGGGSGLLGAGWGISGLSEITRCPSTLDQDGVVRTVELNTNDRFCLDGNKLRTTSGGYGAHLTTYQTEVDIFSRVTSYTSGAAGYVPSSGPQYFRVEGKDGLFYFYGSTEDARIQVKGTSVPRAWALNRVEDRSGNYLTISYTKGVDGSSNFNGSYRPNVIEWARTAAGAGPYFRVNYLYENRPDVETSYFAGGAIVHDKRLDQLQVQAFENSSWGTVRTYDVSYESTLPSTARSRIASITQCSATECLPATAFQYQNGTVGWDSVSANVFVPNGQFDYAHSIDFNGDGRTDVVYPDSGTWRYMKANVSGLYDAPVNTFVPAGSGANPPYWYALNIDSDSDGRREVLFKHPSSTTLYLLRWNEQLGSFDMVATNMAETLNGKEWVGDFDGDGREDFMYARVVSNYSYVYVRRGQGNGLFGAQEVFYSANPNEFPAVTGGGTFASTVIPSQQHLTDFNGDGRTDMLFHSVVPQFCGDFECGPAEIWEVLISTGNAFTLVPMGACGWPIGPCPGQTAVGDFNGDGLTDLLVPYADIIAGSFQTIRFGSGGALPFSDAVVVNGGCCGAGMIVDYDSDGRDDILIGLSGGWQLHRSIGENFAAPVATGIPYTATSTNPRLQIVDVDGDGQHDVGYFESSAWKLRKHSGVFPDLLSRATDGLGNYAAPTYLPLTNSSVYTKGSGAVFPLMEVQAPVYVVSGYSASSGVGPPVGAADYSVSYKYEAARGHLQGRGFLGFAKRTRTDGRAGNQLITVENYRQDFPFTGNPSGTTTYQPASTTPLSAITYTYLKHDLDTTAGNKRVFPFNNSAIEDKYEAGGLYNGQLIARETTTSSYDTHGNLTSQLTVAQDMHSSSPVQGATYSTEAVNTVVPNTSTWCISAVTQAVIRSKPHGQATWTPRTKTFVNDNAKCRADSETIEPGGALQVITAYTYYANGQIQTRTVTGSGMAGRGTTYEYHPAGALVTREINALGQSTYSEWATGLQVETARIDVNSKRIEWGYDSLGRKNQERRPDSTRTDYQYFACTTGCGHPTGKYQIVASGVAQGSVYGQSAVVHDMLGRAVQETEWLLGGVQAHVLTEYDVMGRSARKSAPFWTGNPVYWATTSYDLMGRPTQEQRQVGESDGGPQTIAWFYEGLRTRQTDPENKTITRRTNVIGQVVQMTDSAGTHTWYQYDPFGNNTRTAFGDANGVETPGTAVVTNYDLRGRKDNATDPNTGYWDYTFNALDELTAQLDAKNQTVSFQYDALGRVTQRTEPEGITTFEFDTATNGIGELRRAAGPGYVEVHAFDSIGRPTTTTTTIDGVAYVVTTAYNTFGQVDTTEYPASYPAGHRFKIRYAYDFGILKRVSDANDATKVFWEAVDTDAAGAIFAERLGNGIGITSWHDNVSGFLRQRYSGPGFGSSTQALQYQWDRSGNLKQRRDNNQNFTEDFYYDNLYRLDYSTLTTGGTTVTNLDLSYDALGNITSMTGAGTYTYHATKKHAVTRTTLSGVHKDYTYDNNGNMLTRAGSTIDWYSYNLPRVLRQGADSSEFFYGPDRSRFKQIAIDDGSTETTVYVGAWLERVTKPSGVIEYKHMIPGSEAGAAIYTRRSNSIHDTRYLTMDHLGSIDTISNETGTVLTRLSYDAFGKRRDFTSGTAAIVNAVTHHGFTGHEMLDNVDLVHMNGRVYDPLTGRFISADPFVQEPLFSQSLNRYSYVANNPLSYVDPSGYSWLSKWAKKLRRSIKKFLRSLRDVIPEVIGAIVAGVCMAFSEGLDGGACIQAGAAVTSALNFALEGSNSARGPPEFEPPTVGRSGTGMSLPPGTIMSLGVPAGNADSGPTDDLYGDPLFDTIIDVLKGALIPGYDLYLVYKNPNATWKDWAEAIASTAISLTPFKAAQLAFKVLKAVKKVRKLRLDKIIRAPCCFAAGTPVQTAKGLKPIETLRVGDVVLARDERTGATAHQPITQIFINDQMSVWELEIVDASGATEIHEVTDNHPYRVVGLGWVEVEDLEPGMALETQDGPGVNIVRVSDTGVVERTYNLEVAEFHTFFVGHQHVLVHNTCKVPDLNVDEAKKAGRRGKQDRLRELADDPKVASHERGWIRNEMRHIESGNRKTIRNPRNSRNSSYNEDGGKVLAHRRGKRAVDGNSYDDAVLQDSDLHRLEHKYEGY